MRHLLRNITSTYFVYGIRLLLPLVLLPLLAHRLGAGGFGVVLTAQSLGLLGSAVSEYGFHLAGARSISLATSRAEENKFASRILAAQVLLALASALLVTIGGLLTVTISDSITVILAVVVIAIANGLSPVWYFRGKGMAATAILVEAISQTAVLLGVVTFVHSSADVSNAVIAVATGPVLALGLFANLLARSGYQWVTPALHSTMRTMREAFPLFVARAGGALYTVAALWLMSFSADPIELAYFGVALKMASIVENGMQPAIYVALPKFMRDARDQASALYLNAVRWVAGLLLVALALTVVIQLSSDAVVRFAFPRMIATAGVLESLSWVTIFISLRLVLGSLVLTALHRDRQVSIAIVTGGITFVALGSILAPEHGAYGMVSARMACEVTITALMLFSVLHGRKAANRE